MIFTLLEAGCWHAPEGVARTVLNGVLFVIDERGKRQERPGWRERKPTLGEVASGPAGALLIFRARDVCIRYVAM
jgi:hypothetical protein